MDSPIHTLLILLLLCRVLPVPEAGAQILQIRPQRLDFGTVKIDALQQGRILLNNPGEDNLAILVRLRGPHFAASPDTLHLKGRTEATIKIDFTPPAAGSYKGALTLLVRKDFTEESFTISLQAEAVQAVLRISPGRELRVDPLAIGATSRHSLTLANPAAVPLFIDSLTLDPASGAFQLVDSGPLQLNPGQERDVDLIFAPGRGGLYRNRLVVHSADIDSASLAISVEGEGLAPRATFSPLPQVGLDFGRVELGQTLERPLTVLNLGRSDLRLEGLHISSGAFVASWEGASDTSVAAGGRVRIGIAFRPLHEGSAGAKLTLHTNDPDHPLVEIPLSGTARISPAHIEILSASPIDFGGVALGKYARDHLLLWNRGGHPFSVEARIEGSRDQEFVLESPMLLLQPGESKSIPLVFSPREGGERRAVMVVNTEAGPLRIELRGSGKYLKLNPAAIDFDRVAVGESNSLVVELLNGGNVDFTVDGINSSKDDFSVYTEIGSANKVILPANGLRSLPLSLTFSPSVRGTVSSALRIEGYWEEGRETLEILLTGTGVAGQIELHPAGPLEFGFVELGGQEAVTLVATNSGDSESRVEARALSREAYLEPSVFTLQPGESTRLQVYFSPEAQGDRRAQILVISDGIKEKARPILIKGMGALKDIDLTRIATVTAVGKSRIDTLEVKWNKTPLMVADGSKIHLAFTNIDSLRHSLVGRRIAVEWIKLDDNYDPKGSAKRTELRLYEASQGKVEVENLNLRLLETSNKRVRLQVTSRSHPEAAPQSISQIIEVGGWKWEFEARPLVSFLTVRPGRDHKDAKGNRVKGKTERLIGLPGLAFGGWHNPENPSISGVHFTAIGNVLEALSTDNSIAISVGLAVSLYKDKFLLGCGWDVYDSRTKAKRKSTQDYILTFKYSGWF